MASKIISTDAWTRARERFIEDLTEDEKIIFAGASFENVFYSASAAQKVHAAESCTRHAATKMNSFLTAINQYGEALDVYSNISPTILCTLWGSLRILIYLSMEFEKYFERLVAMFAEIGDIVPRFRVYEKLFPSHERLTQALSVVYLDIIKFCTDAKAVFKKGKSASMINARVLLKLTWKPFDQKFRSLLEDFRNHRKAVEKEAELSNMIEAEDARALERINKLQVQMEKDEAERLHLLSLLSTVQWEKQQTKLLAHRNGKTGLWILDTKEFKNWDLVPESSCLTCYGIPGSGKTILAAVVVDTLSKQVDRQKSAIAYFYCDYADRKTLEYSCIVGTIIQQMLILRSVISEATALKIRSAFGSGDKEPNSSELMDIVRSALDGYERVYFLIDGLDECEQEVQDGITTFVKQIAEIDTTILKIYISSREDPQISLALKEFPSIQLSKEAMSNDIAAYVESTVNDKLGRHPLIIKKPAMKQEAISELITKAQGMFLWVFFQMEELCDFSHSEESFRLTLKDLPQGLTATYKRIFQKIEGKNRRSVYIARKVFKWMLCTRRPLMLDELKEAIAIEPMDSLWDSAKIPADPDGKSFLQSCGNLIVFDASDSSVRLVHHTVSQFLTEYHFQRNEADVLLGETCLTYLLFSNFETQITRTVPKSEMLATNHLGPSAFSSIPYVLGIASGIADFVLGIYNRSNERLLPSVDYIEILKMYRRKPLATDVEQRYRLLNYVVENWVWHTKSFSELDFEESKNKQLEAFHQISMLKKVALIRNLPFDHRPWGSNSGSTRLPYVKMFIWALENCHGPLMHLLIHPPMGLALKHYLRLEGSVSGWSGEQPAVKAAVCGHTTLLDLFIKLDRTILSQARVLNQASSAGQVDTVKFLLRKGAKLHLKDDGGSIALHHAAKFGRTEVVRELLDRGADIEARNHIKNTPLLEAVALPLSNASTVSLLLDRGANVESATSPGRTPLWIATGHDGTWDQATVQLLLENGANLDVMEKSHDMMFRLLLNGSDTTFQIMLENMVSIENWDSLAIAMLAAALDINEGGKAMLLVENLPNVNGKNVYGQTPLQMATRFQRVDLMGRLIERGADVNSGGNSGLTPLGYAARDNLQLPLAYLVDIGANIEIGDKQSAAIHLALQSSHDDIEDREAIVRKLLARGSDVLALNGEGQNAIDLAVKTGNVPIVQMIFQHRRWGWASYDSLRQAVSQGHIHMLKYLFTDEMSPWLDRDKIDFSELMGTVRKNDIQMMELLHDLKEQRHFGSLRQAVSQGHIHTLPRYLLTDGTSPVT